MPFTAEELAEMARADAEIEADFFVTNEEFALSRELDREAELAAMDPQKRKVVKSKQRYYAANREKIIECSRRYRAANKEKVSEYKRRYYAAHKDEAAEYSRHYQAANKEKIAEHKRRYRAANKEKLSEQQRRYRAANREKYAEAQRRYYAANKDRITDRKRRYWSSNSGKVSESKQAIKAARVYAGLTQRTAAQLFDTTRSTISYWENVSAPENWQEIVEIILAKGKAAAPAGTRTTAVE